MTLGVEVFNWGSGERVATAFQGEDTVVAADCNLESDHGPIIVIATSSGKVKILDADQLGELWVIDLNSIFAQDVPPITCLSCCLE